MAEFDSVSTTNVCRNVRLRRRCQHALSDESIEQRRLIAFNLNECIDAGLRDDAQCFVWWCNASNVNNLPVDPNDPMSSCAAAISPPSLTSQDDEGIDTHCDNFRLVVRHVLKGVPAEFETHAEKNGHFINLPQLRLHPSFKRPAHGRPLWVDSGLLLGGRRRVTAFGYPTKCWY
ncbi:hypothetical protein QN362_04335 [Actimicrobium sp. CCC2.4]|uniref:hypothetical protein n=1 Tax=Actimicrobium sp. CCC2.4 TaxID=3048606 RepID=UPI002AC9DD27|nr:hypothetical protein [Actimicrobium sp. CCC2.4]MEB0134556.1 hypothetical protein [Actimicrobium sp. CCC2.4]WPX33999.1 hypothetical protein RHM62_09420 [Actimicrobium sp. CCC2.4]